MLGNITVRGAGQLALAGLSNLATAGAKVTLEPGYLNTYRGANAGGVNSNTDNFMTPGGALDLTADFDPTPSIISGTSSGGTVALSATNTQTLNVAAWGDGTIRLGAINFNAASAATFNANGTLQALTGGVTPTTLLLGNTGQRGGITRNTTSTLQINSILANANMSGVNIAGGTVAFNATNTYTGPDGCCS